MFWGGGHCTKNSACTTFRFDVSHFAALFCKSKICLQICCRSGFPCEEVRRSWCLYSLLSKEDTFIGEDSRMNSGERRLYGTNSLVSHRFGRRRLLVCDSMRAVSAAKV
jgi:hypothetical protein